uniref:Uncharacterized protein n=1 Tax=Astatotilapia calliptera TaxID=8154 RepID=A0A3P8NSQ0_ASTCA
MFILVFLMRFMLTRDFHHAIFCLHHQVLSLLSHHFWSQDGWPQVPWPVGAGKCCDVLGQGGHTEGLVKDTAALVPVTKWVPARSAEQGERNTSLSHDDLGISSKLQRTWHRCRNLEK